MAKYVPESPVHEIYNNIMTMLANLPTYMNFGKYPDNFYIQLDNNNEVLDFMIRETNEEDGEQGKLSKIVGHKRVHQNCKDYNGKSYIKKTTENIGNDTRIIFTTLY